jgi:pyruvate-formate lyase-activating enzyme
MKLEDIGFYTLSDYRVEQLSFTSPLWRCELLLTDRCNFKCPYCRGMKERSDLTFDQAADTLRLWMDDGLKNVRFSGGEPTLWSGLLDLVKMARNGNVQRVAISTNGSASETLYRKLIDAGANDFSVSLDACCAGTMGKMSGHPELFTHLCSMIQMLSAYTYTTVGIVVTPDNLKEARETIFLAHSLGVHDIRVIPASQHTELNLRTMKLSQSVLSQYPILEYRMGGKRPIRGIWPGDAAGERCWLVVDDMAVMGDVQYPCIIYLREGGEPIGKVGPTMRHERINWSRTHIPRNDVICRTNCLDVCVEHNNACQGFTNW